MFDNKQQALDYYSELIEQEAESEIDSTAINILLSHHTTKGVEWHQDSKKNLYATILETKQRISDMIKDLKRAETEDYEEYMKERYEDQDDEFYEKYPRYKDWEGSKDYYSEIEFNQSMMWDDFNAEFRDELGEVGGFRDEHELLRRLSDIEDELSDIPDKLAEIRSRVGKDVIRECFDD